MRITLVALLAAALLTGCGSHKAGSHKTQHNQAPKLTVGAVEDAAKWSPNPSHVMSETRDSGFSADVFSAVWHKGAPADADLPPLRKAVKAAVAAGIEPLLSVYQTSGDTPTSDSDRQAFADYTAALARALPSVHSILVGNEPNLNLFWLPQFGSDGSDTAAPGYEQLLATTYDALKAVNSGIQVIGANLAPRGGDDPGSTRPTHSPTTFIRDLGAAYKASGRTKPLMDAIAVHVYGESSHVPPTFVHPKSSSLGIADYDKLVQLIDTSFHGTGQPTDLPIVYGEYGVETTVPADKRSLYTGHEVVPTVDAATQAQYYKQAIELTRRQPRVSMFFIFHVFDETKLEGLQSGVRYADGSPKPSSGVIRQLESSS
jgi:hypothetical protein